MDRIEQQAESLIQQGMEEPYTYKTRHAAAVAALNAVAFNIAEDLASGDPVTDGQLDRFRYLNQVVRDLER